MGVKNTVFASRSERENFQKLSRTWGDKYRVYHNLPFLNVFSISSLVDYRAFLHDLESYLLKGVTPAKSHSIEIGPVDFQRLKKTSIDYTLCDQQDRPIVCIEFDGMQQGFNVGTKYHPRIADDPWRQTIMNLKLKVAHGSMFPYFVVGSNVFDDFSEDVKLTIVDGVIGEILAQKATKSRFDSGFDPSEIGMSQEDFDTLQRWEQEELIQDWALGVEVEAEMEHNPVTRKRCELQQEFGVKSWSIDTLAYPDMSDLPIGRRRIEAFENAILRGAKVTLSIPDLGEVHATAWLPNFSVVGFSGVGLLEDIAFIMAVEKLRNQRFSESPRQNM